MRNAFAKWQDIKNLLLAVFKIFQAIDKPTRNALPDGFRKNYFPARSLKFQGISEPKKEFYSSPAALIETGDWKSQTLSVQARQFTLGCFC